MCMARIKHPPKRLQGLLWSTDVRSLDIEKDKRYIIHQLLRMGDFRDLTWLFRTYKKSDIIDTFISKPQREYPKKEFYFVKNMLLSLDDVPLNEYDYVTSFSGRIRQRTEGPLA